MTQHNYGMNNLTKDLEDAACWLDGSRGAMPVEEGERLAAVVRSVLALAAINGEHSALLDEARAIERGDIVTLGHMALQARYRVPVSEWYERPDELLDAPAYLFDEDAKALGMECWRLVDDVDKDRANDLYDVWLASGRSLDDRPADYPLYVSLAHFAKLKS